MWKQSFINNIPKAVKSDTDPEKSIRIDLAICVCKTMDKMFNKKLTWYLETDTTFDQPLLKKITMYHA